MKIVPDFDSAFKESPPDVGDSPKGQSEYSIRDIPVMNTVQPPAGVPTGPTGKVPSGLPFDK